MTSKKTSDRGYRVLIVDDTPFNIMVVENFLKSVKGFKIECLKAFNGLQAIEIITKDQDIDIIFMDCNMPVMNGYEASVEIKRMMNLGEIKKDLPILAVSAYTGEKEKEKCIESGMDDYISKPLSQEKFLEYFYKWTRDREEW